MDITLDSTVVQEVLQHQLAESDDNRRYLMVIIKQLEKNHKTEIEELKQQHAAELEQLERVHQDELAAALGHDNHPVIEPD